MAVKSAYRKVGRKRFPFGTVPVRLLSARGIWSSLTRAQLALPVRLKTLRDVLAQVPWARGPPHVDRQLLRACRLLWHRHERTKMPRSGRTIRRGCDVNRCDVFVTSAFNLSLPTPTLSTLAVVPSVRAEILVSLCSSLVRLPIGESICANS